MPRHPITDKQHEAYMTERIKHGRTQWVAALKAGISLRTAKRIDKDPRPPSEKRRERRHGGVRPDPLGKHWEEICVPLLEKNSDIRAVTLLGVLEEVVPGFDAESSRRTLERRVRCWKALHGPEKDIMFRQEKEPGRFCMSDFTLADRLGVTIREAPLKHRLYHFCVPYSGWEHAEIVLGGESFVALTSGVQNALFELGGVPREHRTDRFGLVGCVRQSQARRQGGLAQEIRGVLRRMGHDADAQQSRRGLRPTRTAR